MQLHSTLPGTKALVVSQGRSQSFGTLHLFQTISGLSVLSKKSIISCICALGSAYPALSLQPCECCQGERCLPEHHCHPDSPVATKPCSCPTNLLEIPPSGTLSRWEPASVSTSTSTSTSTMTTATSSSRPQRRPDTDNDSSLTITELLKTGEESSFFVNAA